MFETWTEYGLTSIAIFIIQCAEMEGVLLLKEICEVRLAMGHGRIEGSERQTKKQRKVYEHLLRGKNETVKPLY